MGLLDEPPRDSSGYRRYTAADALKLVKIRILAEAGVPLARIKDLLAADPDEFTAAVADIDRSLQERAEAIQPHPRTSGANWPPATGSSSRPRSPAISTGSGISASAGAPSRWNGTDGS